MASIAMCPKSSPHSESAKAFKHVSVREFGSVLICSPRTFESANHSRDGSGHYEQCLGSRESAFVSDWRIDTAKRIKGARLRFRTYRRRSEKWDHEHCVGCWAKFMESRITSDILTEGYATEDDEWVCPKCFEDLRRVMEWKLVESWE